MFVIYEGFGAYQPIEFMCFCVLLQVGRWEQLGTLSRLVWNSGCLECVLRTSYILCLLTGVGPDWTEAGVFPQEQCRSWASRPVEDCWLYLYPGIPCRWAEAAALSVWLYHCRFPELSYMTCPAASAGLYLFPLATFCWSNWAPAAIRKTPTFSPTANCPWGPRSTFSCTRGWVYLSIRNLDRLGTSLNHRILLSIACLTHTAQELLAHHRGTWLAYFAWTARSRSPESSPAHACRRSWKCWIYSCNSTQCCRDPLSSMLGWSCLSLCALVSLVPPNCSSCINGRSRGTRPLRSSGSWSFAVSPSSACRLRNGLVQLTPGFSLI